jgi:hypothetical protein
MAVNFDTSKLNEEQLATYNMQKSLQAEQSAGQMMNLALQAEQQQLKERFDLLSNTMKSMGDSKANIANNLK